MDNENDNSFRPHANYAIILRCDINEIGPIVEMLKGMSNVKVVYQKMSTSKLFITTTPPERPRSYDNPDDDDFYHRN